VICAILPLNVGRISVVRVLVASLLVGSAALAQQGLIIEPWRRVAVPAAAPVEPARVLPASGLDKDRSALPPVVAHARIEPTVAPPRLVKWSPPVVELLVDPWATARAVAQAPRPRWVPRTVEIIDPWADEKPRPPRVATGPNGTGPSGTERSTIF
jgi:hypothetical protein